LTTGLLAGIVTSLKSWEVILLELLSLRGDLKLFS